ncbi:cysteine protease ATG4B-like [Iris pallida]|uniref:Cysteine protease n=1 Tax=Iris pallida TaxID=29817 RepID=A0AAX6DLN4_IRIPA|nr:cysteine protease ATG4B-like [Iris pallida]
MTDLPKRAVDSNFPAGHLTDSLDRELEPTVLGQEIGNIRSTKSSLWSKIFTSKLCIRETHHNPSSSGKETKSISNGWSASLRRVVTGGAMRRLQERILGTSRADVSSSASEIWLLGMCYKASPEESQSGANNGNGVPAFLQDFSSRIWITYRKGFDAISNSKFTSDVNWGCMIRSSQMLVAQALLFHHLGRAWRKPSLTPYEREYIQILHLFGDSEACAFSIHNLIRAGSAYGLTAGSWLGPYAVCRTWETLARANREHDEPNIRKETLPMAVYIVSGDGDGEHGGAPVICVDVAARICADFSNGQFTWTPILLLVPLVLGLEKVNPRYIPLLRETFTFPQSLGILGGKPGASTYMVGVQDDKALYLDPHEVQSVVQIKRDNLEADTSSYHCSNVRNLPLDQIDPSLAIGFYCRDKDDFDDLCWRASELGEKSNGAPLFTVTWSLQPTRPVHHHDSSVDRLVGGASCGNGMDEPFGVGNSEYDTHTGEDEWQIL